MISGQDPFKVWPELDDLSHKIHTFVIPKNPLVALERSTTRHEKAVGSGQAFVAHTLGIHPVLCVVDDSSYVATKVFGFKNSAKQLFDHARYKITAGELLSPFVTIDFAGSLDQLKSLPGFQELDNAAKSRKIKLTPSLMSVAGGIYTSVGSISLAMAAERHEWQG